VCLESPCGTVKGRTCTEVCDNATGTKHLIVYPSGINTVGRQQLAFGESQVSCWEAESLPATVSGYNNPFHRISFAKKPGSRFHFAEFDMPSNTRAADRVTVKQSGRNGHDLKTSFLREGFHRTDVTGTISAEPVIISHDDGFGLKIFYQISVYKILRTQLTEVIRERHNGHYIHVHPLERCRPLF
jgi:hypothetical protein